MRRLFAAHWNPYLSSPRAALTFVLLSVFIDSIGFGIIIPSMPAVIMQLTGESISSAAGWGGYLMAVYALLQFFMAPIFGNLSDRFGRRPVLLASLAAFGVDFLLTGWRPPSRGCSSAVPWRESSAHRSPPPARTSATSATTRTARAISVSSAPRGVSASTLGPAIGGPLPNTSIRARRSSWRRRWRWPTSRSGTSCCPSRCHRSAAASSSGCAPTRSARSRTWPIYPWSRGCCSPCFLYQMAHDSLPAVWMYYTQYRFGWSTSEMGWSLTFVGVMTVIVMGGFDRLIVPRIGERRAIIIGFLLMTVGFVGYALATQGWMLYVALAIGSLGGIANPAVQSVMSKQAGPSAQGELQGGVASINSIAAVLSPIFMTQLFRYYSDAGAPIHFPGAPYLVSAVFVFFCVLICARAVKMGTFLDS
jgi:DHA1 family tetracycline resistance protein-like MFS transporter